MNALSAVLLLSASIAMGQDELPNIETRVKGLEVKQGLMNLYLDQRHESILMELPSPNAQGLIAELLYVEGLLGGLGSNDIGLDRGQLGDTQVIHIKRVGIKVLFEAQNLRFRATSGEPGEDKAVRESFASSVIWAGRVVAQNSDGRSLIDISSFVLRDAHDTVEATRPFGRLNLDRERSAIDFANTLAFPNNLEFEAILTFNAADPASQISQTVPSAKSVTLIQHQSLIALPDSNYKPRAFDPRAGIFGDSYFDYSTPIAEPIEKKRIVRHRLQKTTSGSAPSTVVEPIVYYVDHGAPEPIRSALLDGARWWSAAFEKAGFKDAFRVEVLPEHVHPLDIRYNVIQWVHRSTRGWSYGNSIVDPRTGEILKGHVSLGSLRVRHDRMIFEGLLGTEKTGTGSADDPVQLSLARIRQLSAHELGHTLGLAHNFAASTYGRSSVMDYPSPWVGVTPSGDLDVSRVYGVGVGEWDRLAIAYAYSEFDEGKEAAGLKALMDEGIRRKLLFLSDSDARALGAAHPLAALWDNGNDPIKELDQVMRVRRIALGRFGEDRILKGTPTANLEEVLGPIYLYHRYQVETVAKMVGGYKYGYKVRGDAMPPAEAVSADRQRDALAALLRGLDPKELAVPEQLLGLIGPRAFGYESNRELFPRQTGAAFDTLAAVAACADLTIAPLLDSSRAARIVELHLRDASLPSLEEVLTTASKAIFANPTQQGERDAEVRRTVQTIYVYRLAQLAGAGSSSGVRSRADAEMANLQSMLKSATGMPAALAHARWLSDRIELFRKGEKAPELTAPRPAPPGSPIGWCDL